MAFQSREAREGLTPRSRVPRRGIYARRLISLIWNPPIGFPQSETLWDKGEAAHKVEFSRQGKQAKGASGDAEAGDVLARLL